MRAAIIENGTVVNIAEADETFAQSQGWVITNEAQVGWSYDNDTFSPPPVPPRDLAKEREEANIPKAEFVLGLINLGILQPEDALLSAKGNWPTPMSDFLGFLTPEQATQAQIEWATRTVIWRTNTFVLSLASFLNLDDTTVDTLFGIT